MSLSHSLRAKGSWTRAVPAHDGNEGQHTRLEKGPPARGTWGDMDDEDSEDDAWTGYNPERVSVELAGRCPGVGAKGAGAKAVPHRGLHRALLPLSGD
jgi:hypothetical protein